MLKFVWCLLHGGHTFVKLVIPRNSFGDLRREGKICKNCGCIKNLIPKDNDFRNVFGYD